MPAAEGGGGGDVVVEGEVDPGSAVHVLLQPQGEGDGLGLEDDSVRGPACEHQVVGGNDGLQEIIQQVPGKPLAGESADAGAELSPPRTFLLRMVRSSGCSSRVRARSRREVDAVMRPR